MRYPPCWPLSQPRRCSRKQAFHWHQLALQHLKLPVSTTRWHSCIEGRVQALKQETRAKPGNQMFQCVCVVTAEATTRYVTSCISIVSVSMSWERGSISLRGFHRLTAFILVGNLNFCHAERKKPKELSECLLPFQNSSFAHLATRLKPFEVKCTITFWDSLSSSGEKQVKLMKEWLYEAYSRHESLVREYGLT